MVFYLKSYDPIISISEYARYNVTKTTLLDRFFMLILKISKYELLESMVIDKNQM